MAKETAMEKRRKGNFLRHMERHWPYYVMMAPGVIYLALFKYIPMLGSVIAFQDFSIVRGVFGSAWTGLANFRKLFQYDDAQHTDPGRAEAGDRISHTGNSFPDVKRDQEPEAEKRNSDGDLCSLLSFLGHCRGIGL